MNSSEGSKQNDPHSAEERYVDEPSGSTITPRQLLLLWVMAGSLLLALVPFGLLSRSLRSNIQAAEAEFKRIQSQLAETPSPPSEVQPLLATLESLHQQAEALEDAADTLTGAQIYWPAVMDAVRKRDPEQLALTALTQEGRQIILEGDAINDGVVVDYAQSLEASGLFSRVLIQSIDLLDPDALTATPEATLTATPSPTQTVSPTPSLRDAYEVDDFDPVPIFFGQPQLHNFYPIYDIDKVTFLAKAGRYYRVYTTDLRPGVDTVLEVRVGGESYRNDDRAAGFLSSEIVFQAGSYDTDVVVKISNRGEYGPERAYRVAVEEVLLTATQTPAPVSPTPTLSPAPTSSPTPTFTPSSTPVPQQSPTPDRRDAFEPDQPDPPSIALGETQGHNFYPTGDVDHLIFLAKAGRSYRVSTSNLSVGVDTILTVTVGAETVVHDDRSASDLGSEVIVTVPEDQDYEANITVANRGEYGAQLYYQISLKEVIVTPTPTFTPTSTLTPTESSSQVTRPSGLARTLPRWQFLPAEQTFTNPEAVRFVIVMELEANAP